MSRIIVYGCGGLGLEVISYLKDLERQPSAGDEQPPLVGVIDQGVARLLDAEAVYGSSLGCWATEDEVPWQEGDKVLIAVGEPDIRHQILLRLTARSVSLYTLIHPTAYVSSTAVVGEGTIIAPFSFIGPFATIGTNTVLNTYSSAGHDCMIGNSSVLSPYAALNGSAELGMAVFLGSGSLVLPGVVVGKNSKISAGAAVYRDVEANSLVTGNPAKSRVMFTEIN